MILTLFLHAELRSKYTHFFITGFLICHSFLDFLYIGVFARICIFHYLKKKLKWISAGWWIAVPEQDYNYETHESPLFVHR